jgi:HAD superfamily hydrolase (TIGR01490 family)
MTQLVLFDLDNTLLAGDSDHAWGEFLAEVGIVDPVQFRAQNDAFWAEYKRGTLDIQAYLRFALSSIAGKTDGELKPLVDAYLAQRIEPIITKAGLAAIGRHAADLCAIVTATNAFVTRPIAARLGVSNLIACEVEQVGGRYTGEPQGIPSFREGKIVRVEQWLQSMGQDWRSFESTWFYSDSLNDLPLLNHVSHPVAVNPDPTLRAHAERQGWRIESWT